MQELLPGILTQMGPESFMGLKNLMSEAGAAAGKAPEADEVADFEAVSKDE